MDCSPCKSIEFRILLVWDRGPGTFMLIAKHSSWFLPEDQMAEYFTLKLGYIQTQGKQCFGVGFRVSYIDQPLVKQEA